jgi:hypothetical protein
MLGQLRNLFEQVVKNPERRVSEFTFPDKVGDPIPAFAPRTKLSSSRTPVAPELKGPTSSIADKSVRQPRR